MEKNLDKMTLQFQEDATKWKEKPADKQEDQWATVHEQHDTTLREVLTQVEPADSVRLLTWFFSTTENPGVASTPSMGEVLATAMQLRTEVFADNTTPGLKSSYASLSVASPVLTSSPEPEAHNPPPLALPMSDIKASGTPVGFLSLMLIVTTKPKKHNHSSNSASNDQCNKRAHVRIKKESINGGGFRSHVNTRSVPLVTKHDTAPIEGGREQEPLTNIGDAKCDKHNPIHKHSNVSSECFYMSRPCTSPLILPGPAKGNADSNDVVVVEDSGSMGDWDENSIMGVGKDDADQDDDETDSETESLDLGEHHQLWSWIQ